MMSIILIFNLIFSISEAAVIKPIGMLSPHHIHSQIAKEAGSSANCEKSVDNSLVEHSFTAEIECNYRCSGDKKPSFEKVSKFFNPDDEGLRQGDGYDKQKTPLMSSFTGVFVNWSTQVCLNESVVKCGSVEKVDSADFSSITSGNWKLSEKPTCEQNKKILYSPYDPQFKLNREHNKKFFSFLSNDSKKSDSPTGKYIPFPEQGKKSSCKNIMKGKVCFGDCILYDDKNPKAPTPFTLMTKESPVFDQEEWLCADALFAAYSKTALSKNVAESICQNFFIKTLSEQRAQGSSCAAYRGSADCSAFISSVSAH